MANLRKLYPQLLGDLALEPRENGTAVGRRGGFPLGMQIVQADGKGTVMLQTRYPSLAEAPAQALFAFGHMLQRLISEKLAEVKIEKDIAFLSLRKVTDRIEKREAVVAVDEFIDGLSRAGLSAGEACHYCGAAEDVQTIFNGSRVGQICATCTRQQAVALMDERRFDPKSVSNLGLIAAAVTPVMAAAWMGLWYGVDLWMTSQGGTMHLSIKLALIVAFFLGMTIAAPALLFRRIPHRGNIRAGILGGVCGLVAFALGEVALSTLAIWRSFGVINVRAAVSIAVPMLFGGNGFFLAIRGTALAGLLISAFTFAKPPKAKLKL
jgi:hypothetical protein